MLLRTPFLSLFAGCAALVLPACGGSTATPDKENSVVGDGGPDTRPVVDGGAEASEEASAEASSEPIACNPVTTSTLPHVHIVFQATKCTFTLAEAAAKIAIPYDLVVDEDVPGFVPASPYRYGSSAANLVLDEDIKGGSQLYCLCDTGLPAPLCPLDDGGAVFSDAGPLGACPAVTIPAGTYHRVITWDGRNWTGPSDTDNPEGPPFPPGDYAVEVATEAGSIGDAGALSASGKLPIRLVP